jgi:hypothetical protein
MFAFNEFKAGFPSTIFSLKTHPCKGYRDALSAGCVIVAITYLNNVIENFEKRRLYYFHRSIKTIYTVNFNK